MKTNFSKIVAIVSLIAPLAGFAQNSALLTAFTNPTPATYDFFGESLAAVGTDRVLIAASGNDTGTFNAGVAYLFSTSGTLLTTFTNPTPIAEGLGHSVAAVGTDTVLIGAPGRANSSGIAYLFNTNGVLFTTFSHPYRGPEFFGSSVTAVGIDRVLIGAPRDGVAAFARFGAAYLFSTNGALLNILTNPTPADRDQFASSVAAVGNDRVLIGTPGDDTGASDAGAAYLFSTNGTLLTTYTNPAPAVDGSFGISVAALGTDRVFIGAYGNDIGASYAGAAYLFSTNGALLTTFTNPTPGTNDYFGASVAAVGTNRVLIGAYGDNTDPTADGTAYLFSTDGALLTTFNNPTPGTNDYFGYSVATVGSDRVLIGAYFDDTGASDAGAAYLFVIQPTLAIRRTITNTVVASWPSAWTGFKLQQNTNGITTADWIDVGDTIQTTARTGV